MTKSHLREDIHKMRFEEIYSSYTKRRLSCEEASEILGVSVRTFHRELYVMNQTILMVVLTRGLVVKALTVLPIKKFLLSPSSIRITTEVSV